MTRGPSIDALDRPIAVELDRDTRAAWLDSTEHWLDTAAMLQARYRAHAHAVFEEIAEPHIKELVGRMARTAREHERRLDELYRMIERDPSRTRRAIGTLAGKATSFQADVLGLAGRAAAPWRDLNMLWLAGTGALGAFATAEQLGYALGLPQFAALCFDIVGEKHTQQLVAQELLLEMAPTAILYKSAF